MNAPGFVHRALTLLPLAGALVLGANGPAAGQLAQTPWPMFQHDVRHTGRSALLGPLFPSGAPAPADVSGEEALEELEDAESEEPDVEAEPEPEAEEEE